MTKHMKTIIASSVVAAMLIGFAPSRAEAAWHDRSGSLPGIVSGKKIVILTVVATAGVVALYWIVRKAHKSKTAEQN